MRVGLGIETASQVGECLPELLARAPPLFRSEAVPVGPLGAHERHEGLPVGEPGRSDVVACLALASSAHRPLLAAVGARPFIIPPTRECRQRWGDWSDRSLSRLRIGGSGGERSGGGPCPCRTFAG